MKKIINKNIKVLSIVALAMCLTISCSDELERSPLDQFASESFWTSESNALLALAAVYKGETYGTANANFSDWWSYTATVLLEGATDNSYDRRGNNSPVHRLSNGTMLASNTAIVRQMWDRTFEKIARSNFFIENVGQVPVDAGVVARLSAEARFVRAVQYYYLSQTYGAVPLIERTLTLEESFVVEKAPKSTIIQFVIDELGAIVADLPAYGDMSTAEFGRASKQAALAYLGRMQMADQRFAAAATTYKSIIDLGDNIIDPDYVSLFDGTNEMSAEIIFTMPYIEDLFGNGLQQNAGPAIIGAWHIVNPLGDLVESYEFNDGTSFDYSDPRYDASDLAKDRDPRLSYNVLIDGVDFGPGFKYISHPDSTSSIDRLTTNRQATRTGFGLAKFMNWNYTGNLRMAPQDQPIIRYAEVLLTYLEAKLEAGDAIDQALLDQTINLVRGRTSVNMPPVTETDPDALRVILRRERRNELALEGQRYWDLLRWDIAKDVLNADFYGGPFPGATNLRQKDGVADPHSRWYVTSRSFRDGIDDTWPIPDSEIEINPNLGLDVD
ncbi:MAG: RagB/SusD family nutrient uptake outer membrane protein [Cyclobacteriaceae bacterium]